MLSIMIIILTIGITTTNTIISRSSPVGRVQRDLFANFFFEEILLPMFCLSYYFIREGSWQLLPCDLVYCVVFQVNLRYQATAFGLSKPHEVGVNSHITRYSGFQLLSELQISRG